MAFAGADKLREAIGDTCYSPKSRSITCSFGVAQYAPGETAAELIARADAALYRAKTNGRNQVKLAPQPVLDTQRICLGRIDHGADIAPMAAPVCGGCTGDLDVCSA